MVFKKIISLKPMAATINSRPKPGGKTLDLGYNFIERNNLEKRFEKK
jgi:hypothetical protein